MAGAIGAMALLPAAAGAATITPDISTDEFTLPNGDCSLREAVYSASGNAAFGGCEDHDSGTYGNDTIVLGGVGTFTLTLPGIEDDGETGDLDVTGPLTVKNTGGFENAVVTQSVPDRIFDLRTAGTHLTLDRVTLSGGESGGQGGNIRAAVADNDVTLTSATVANGEALGGAGVRIEGAGSVLSATDTTFSNNVASTGGGLQVYAGATATFTRAFFNLNRATTANPNGQQQGGGLDLNASTAMVLDSTFQDNEASATAATGDWGLGGAIRSNGNLTVDGSLFLDNEAYANGDETALERGGAIFTTNPGSLEVTNSTFYGNVAGNGNDAQESGEGGAIARSAGSLNVNFSTFLGNDVSGAGGAESLDNLNSGGALHFFGNLFAADEGPVCGGDNASLLVSDGYNVGPASAIADCAEAPSDDFAATPTALIAAAPSEHGGPTLTLALGGTGRGLNHIPFAECSLAGGFDARDYPRAGSDVGGACDAGAYERTVCNGVVQDDDFAFCPVVQQPDPPVEQPTPPKAKCPPGKKLKKVVKRTKSGKKRVVRKCVKPKKRKKRK